MTAAAAIGAAITICRETYPRQSLATEGNYIWPMPPALGAKLRLP